MFTNIPLPFNLHNSDLPTTSKNHCIYIYTVYCILIIMLHINGDHSTRDLQPEAGCRRACHKISGSCTASHAYNFLNLLHVWQLNISLSPPEVTKRQMMTNEQCSCSNPVYHLFMLWFLWDDGVFRYTSSLTLE